MEELRECCAISVEQPVKKIDSKKHVDTFFIRIVICNLFINQSRCKMLRKEIKTVNGNDINRRIKELIMMVPSFSIRVVLRGQYYSIDHGVLPTLLILAIDTMTTGTLFQVKLFTHFDVDRLLSQLNSPFKTD